MAQAMAAAAVHSMPPFPLPALPRIRPPPIPKGTPGPNTLPMPTHPPPKNKVWADGKWVLPHESAALHRQKVISRQLEKALKHEVLGMNIYAYRHRTTNQVVYSLTKNMDNNKIMKQLLFHGKKTVPSAIRRDLWSPYFSVHFPQTQDGAAKGLKVYNHLRELTLRRQLDPPKYMKLADEEELQRFKKSAGTNLYKLLNRNRTSRGAKYRIVDLPIPGTPLPQHTLAKRLMYQKGTSVADLAAVLTLTASHGGGIKEQEVDRETAWQIRRNEEKKQKQKQKRIAAGLEEEEDLTEEGEEAPAAEPVLVQELSGRADAKALNLLSGRALRRQKSVRKEEEKRADRINARKVYLQESAGQVKLDSHTLARLSTEFNGSIGTPGQHPTSLNMIDANNQAATAELAYENAIKQMNSEMSQERQRLESLLSGQIEQKLAKDTAENRERIENAIQTQKDQIANLITTETNKVRDLLKQYKDQARAYHSTYKKRTRQTMSDEDRQLIYETNEYLVGRKANLMRRYAKWVGPYAEITDEVDKAMAIIEEAHQERLAELKQNVESELEDKLKRNAQGVIVRWANQADGQYAESWPESVLHGSLENKAVVLQKALVVRQHAYLDETEEPVDEQMAVVDLPRSNSVHVFGGEAGYDNRYKSPEEFREQSNKAREQRVLEHVRTSRIQVRDKIVALHILRDDLMSELEHYNPDLSDALMAQVDSELEEFETDMGRVPGHLNDGGDQSWAKYQLDERAPIFEADLVSSLKEKFSKVTADGNLLDEAGSVIDTTLSEEAKKHALQLADVRAEIAVFEARYAIVATTDVGPFETFATEIKQRIKLAEIHPTAHTWLIEHQVAQDGKDPQIAQDDQLSSESQDAPEGVSAIEEFEANHTYVSGAMQRAALNPKSSSGDLSAINDKIVSLDRKGKDWRRRYESLRARRVKLIQTNNPVFDKEAWMDYSEQVEGYVTKMREEAEAEDTRIRRASMPRPEPEPEAPAGLMDRVKGIFSRK